MAEHVQTLLLLQRGGLFIEVESQGAAFKWQKPAQFYGDITGPMITCSDFRIGSDGQRWWCHEESFNDTNFVACPVKEMHELNITLNDPFDLTDRAPSVAAARLGLKYAGLAKFGATDCFQVEAWQIEPVANMTPFGSLLQWWIDPENYRPAQITVFGCGCVSRMRFLYDSVNEPLPAGDFAVPRLEGQSLVPPEPLDANYTNRFINLDDGSDGRMSVRWGKKGPKGVSSSGLN
jgi:hypothetical protein